ncbi:MAG: hypothetical protein AAGA60_27015 [Cyanobacteria bacterium P01_E01_bin.42]
MKIELDSDNIIALLLTREEELKKELGQATKEDLLRLKTLIQEALGRKGHPPTVNPFDFIKVK